MAIIYFDTETTGFAPGQICELSMIVEENKRFSSAHNYFFSVDKIDEGAEKVHGFSKESLQILSNNTVFKDHSDEIAQILKNNTWVAHNLPFDEKFISIEFSRVGNWGVKPSDRLDTMAYFTDILKIPAKNYKRGKYKFPKLSEVLDYFNIDENRVAELVSTIFDMSGNNQNFHDSRFDTASLYVLTNVYREVLSGGTEWRDKFCRH